MRIYLVQEIEGWDQKFCSTRQEAIKRAATVAEQTGEAVEITEINTVPITPEVLCHILSGWGGYVASEQLSRRVWPSEVEKEKANETTD